MAEVIVEGLDDLLASMESLPLALQKNIIARSLRAAGQPIKEEAQSKAPDDPETPGSRIEVSMKVEVREQTATGAVARIGPSGAGFVGLFSEIGTAHQTAKPWLGPSFEATKDEAFRILGEEMGEQIETEFARKRK